jgi:4-hydroxy-tetrahydrodipicolinate reductase
LKIAINGKSGRMGSLISNAIADRDDGQVVCSLMDQPDVIVDFSSPLATISLLPFAVEHKIPLVIGTTGFSASQQLQITRAAEKISIVQSPNMSTGGNVCLSVVEKISQHLARLGIVFDLAVVEMHHNKKQDAPSGTALRLGEAAEAGGYAGKTQYSSLRLGDISGDHEVIFAFSGEQILVKHHTDTRENFALGAIRAARWIVEKKMPGLYDMHQVLGLDKV